MQELSSDAPFVTRRLVQASAIVVDATRMHNDEKHTNKIRSKQYLLFIAYRRKPSFGVTNIPNFI